MEPRIFKCSRCGVPLGEVRFTNHKASWQVVCACDASYIVNSDGSLVMSEGVRHPKFVEGPPAKRLNIIRGICERAGEHARRNTRLVDICRKEITELQQEVVEEKVLDQKLDDAASTPEQTAEQLIRHFGAEKLAAILDGLN